jgi:phospholipid/cholesterol/gamma-HCH transport system substrate-binding protein
VKRSYIILGLGVIVGVLALLWLAANAATLGSDPGQRFTLRLDDAAGVTADSTVKLAGVEVGRVERIEAVDGRAVVTLVVDAEVEVHADASAGPRARSLLGAKYLELRPGSPDAPRLGEGEEIPGSWTAFEVDEALNALEPVFGPKSLGGMLGPVIDRFEELRGADEDAEPDDPIETAEELEEAIDEIREAASSTRELIEDGRERAPQVLADANAALDGRRLDRALTNLDRLTASAARDLPRLFDDVEAALGRADSALADVDAVTREFTPERIAELDQGLDELVGATHDFAANTAKFQGLGDDVGPLIEKLSTISRRAAAIDELTIRKFLQEEGFLMRMGGGDRNYAKDRIEALDN